MIRYLAILLLGLSCPVLGQTTYEDDSTREVTIYLRDGTSVHGYQKLTLFEGYISVEIDQFTQQHIPYNKIRSVHYGPPLPYSPNLYPVAEGKFIFSVTFGVQFGIISEGDNRAAITIAAGYVFDPKLQLSLGAGYMQYDPFTTRTVFTRVHGLLSPRRWSPLYFFEAGLSKMQGRRNDYISELQNAKGGPTLHAGLGIQRSFKGGAIFLQLGYRLQKAEMDYMVDDFWGGTLEVHEKITYRRVTTTIGLTF